MIYRLHLNRKIYLNHSVVHNDREYTEDIIAFENEDFFVCDMFLNFHGFFHTYHEKMIFYITLEDMQYKSGFQPCILHIDNINDNIVWKNINEYDYTSNTVDILFPENSNKFLTKICKENNIECKKDIGINFWIKIEKDNDV